MANTIRIKKRASTGAAGAPSSLAPSELAFNENTGDKKLYLGTHNFVFSRGNGLDVSVAVHL